MRTERNWELTRTGKIVQMKRKSAKFDDWFAVGVREKKKERGIGREKEGINVFKRLWGCGRRLIVSMKRLCEGVR
jgi:hypothetical protein